MMIVLKCYKKILNIGLEPVYIDCNRVPFSIGFGSITSEILVNALSNRYTHWSSVHNKKRHSCIRNETETYENRN